MAQLVLWQDQIRAPKPQPPMILPMVTGTRLAKNHPRLRTARSTPASAASWA